MKNEYMRPAVELSLPVVAGTKSGDPVRVGAVNGVAGKAINILAIIATLFGSACSLGLGALQIGGGIVAGGFAENVGSSLLILIIAVLTACFVLAWVFAPRHGILARTMRERRG